MNIREKRRKHEVDSYHRKGGGGASIKPVDGNNVLGNVNLKSKGEGSINVFDSSTVVEAIL